MKVELIKLLMNIRSPYGWSVNLTGVLSTDFTYVMCGSRLLPIRIEIILKATHEIGIAHDHNVLALKLMSTPWLLCVSSDILFPLSSHSSSLRSLRLGSKNYCFTKWRFNAEHTFIMHSSLPSTDILSYLNIKMSGGLLGY